MTHVHIAGPIKALLANALGAVIGSLAEPVRTDPTGTTTQPVTIVDGAVYTVTFSQAGSNGSPITSATNTSSISAGATVTVSVLVRQSLSSDAGGANYNGSAPRLIARANPCAGLADDTVKTTSQAAYAPGGASQGQWETLTGTFTNNTDSNVIEWAVDCDGTAGWVNVDNWSSSPVVDTRGGAYWASGAPVVVAGGGSNVFMMCE